MGRMEAGRGGRQGELWRMLDRGVLLHIVADGEGKACGGVEGRGALHHTVLGTGGRGDSRRVAGKRNLRRIVEGRGR